YRHYKNCGYTNASDFFYKEEKFMPLKDLKKYAKKAKINSTVEWRKYWKTNLKPDNIPYKPDYAYKNKGWKGWADFLGM
ncbi:MAG: hypothetical protein ACK5AY_05875, partial [Bacteroidota bacterium]